VILPASRANERVHADPGGTDRPHCGIGDHNRDVANFSNDRTRTVGIAPPEFAWMKMDVGDESSPGPPTMQQDIAKSSAVDSDDPVPQCVWIDVVVEDEFFNPPHLSLVSKQKSGTLASTTSASPEFRNSSTPSPCGTEIPYESAYKRCPNFGT